MSKFLKPAPVTFDLSAVDAPLRPAIEAACRQGVRDAQEQGMRFSKPVVIAVTKDPGNCIPEIGAGGEAGSGGRVNIMYDPDPAKLSLALNGGIAREVTHELNHEWRLQKGHQLKTLGDFLVSEGLAVTAEEAPPHDPLPYTRYKSAAFRDEFIKRVKENIDKPFDPQKDFGPWFFGPNDDRHFGGYALGRDIVRGYLAAHKLSPGKAHNIDAKKITGEWVSGKFALESEQQYAAKPAVRQAAVPGRNP